MKLPSPQTSVQQGAQRRWAPLLVGTNRSYMGWEEQKGHLRCRTDGVWCCTGSGKVAFLSAKALQRTVLWMVSGSDPF